MPTTRKHLVLRRKALKAALRGTVDRVDRQVLKGRLDENALSLAFVEQRSKKDRPEAAS